MNLNASPRLNALAPAVTAASCSSKPSAVKTSARSAARTPCKLGWITVIADRANRGNDTRRARDGHQQRDRLGSNGVEIRCDEGMFDMHLNKLRDCMASDLHADLHEVPTLMAMH